MNRPYLHGPLPGKPDFHGLVPERTRPGTGTPGVCRRNTSRDLAGGGRREAFSDRLPNRSRNRSRSRSRSRRGFSATEVIVCVGVLGLAMIPVMGLFTGGTQQQAFNEYYLMSLNLAQHVSDRVKDRVLSRSFGGIDALGEGVSTPIAQTPYEISDADLVLDLKGDIFKISKIDITKVKTGLAEISVTIEWTLGNARKQRTRTHHFLLCRPDLSLTQTYEPRQEDRK